MHKYKVRYTVVGVGLVEEIVAAASNFMAQRIVEAKYPNQQLVIVQVTQLD